MDKSRLHKIFSKAFNQPEWIEVLKDVFGAKQLLVQPNPIMLPSNDKAKAAYELGNFTTSDDRIIGLYKIELNEDVWLERNKVGLRELLRNVYKYDVDGAIIVFEQSKKWRLSFVSEIKILNDEGEVIEQATEPKRYTYLLGKDEKVRTPSDRLSKLVGKTLALNDILEAFSVEALNEEFYKVIAHYFYQLIGGKIGKDKKAADFGDGILQLPSVPKTNKLVYQEFAVRLIGRTIFSWFLKMKKSDVGKELLPENLLSSNAVKNNSNYYHTILERLFFQTLNTKMENRIDNLPQGSEQIPFLNGGLFEPDTNDYYRPNRTTGISENLNTLKISDDWFLNLFTELEKYNFTIDENSVTDIEVSVDPEMLGRIFENLLAEIDPDSGETARKATGSFYTPREIVDYMATESLVQYLHNKTDLKHEQLRPVFKMTEEKLFDFSDTDVENILDALDKIKILDPACGSGAFPMGVLQKIVMALQKLDPDAEWWKERQVKRIKNQYVRKALREKLEDSSVEYARKIGVIQNSLYGVDIQPIAAEISKLRCFLSLVVDETINENKPNRGIEPLPNLEFKFVTADTLMKLPEQKQQRSMFDNFEELQKLEELRTDYLQSSGKKKEKIKEQYIKVQTKMFKNEMHLFTDTQSRAYKLSSWNPFSHEKADWFDPKWMYGVEDFDVVIGNPPYVQIKWLKNKTILSKQGFKTYVKSGDIYCLFYEKSTELLSDFGVGSFITSNKWLRASYGKPLRNYLINSSTPIKLMDFGGVKVFKSATVDTNILIWNKKRNDLNTDAVLIKTDFKIGSDLQFYFKKNSIKNSFKLDESWVLISDKDKKIRHHVETNFPTLFNHNIELFYGILTGANPVFIIDGNVRNNLIGYDSNNSNVIKPILRGKDLINFGYEFADVYLLNIHNGVKTLNIPPINLETDYPTLMMYFEQFGDKFMNRGEKGENWYNLRSCNYINKFEENKIIYADIVQDRGKFYYDEDCFYTNDTAFIIVGDNIKWLTAILNSKLFTYLYKTFYSGGGLSDKGLRFKKEFIEKVPVPKNVPVKEIFSEITTVLQFINILDTQINPHVPNSHISQLFEEVIDAMVMELYFKDDFKKAGIEFIKYAERDFAPIEHLKTEEEKIEVIHEAYQKLRQKDNEIRNNLKLMDIKLADIVEPIKSLR
ncbi:MAG: hypothetical protein DRJ01_09140 [Bacteroidetes bacterium]|nr:MAG: hypothetical protein DRJ01_09140 [Bacteroidota bacterium]